MPSDVELLLACPRGFPRGSVSCVSLCNCLSGSPETTVVCHRDVKMNTKQFFPPSSLQLNPKVDAAGKIPRMWQEPARLGRVGQRWLQVYAQYVQYDAETYESLSVQEVQFQWELLIKCDVNLCFNGLPPALMLPCFTVFSSFHLHASLCACKWSK